ncbi:MAG: alpha/beta hydrolase [Gammaproteobacteria bacterium]|jgi:fermentation-respiration switch protein FrsA (DUF1100 family)
MIGVIATVVLIAGVFSGFMYINQPDMVFFPLRELRSAPSAWGMQYEDVTIKTADNIDLHGWYIPGNKGAKTLLFFHGNAGNISHRGESVSVFHDMGLNVLIFDYRGYGQSKGAPSEQGLYRDARAAWRYLTQIRGIADHQIILFGRSLGAAVAIKLATEVQAGALIAESTFSSAADMAHHMFPVLSHLIYVRFNFSNIDNISQVRCPVLYAHSPDDDIIPFDLGRKVYEAANEPKFFFKLTGDHNSGFLQSQPEYGRQIHKFIAGLDTGDADQAMSGQAL